MRQEIEDYVRSLGLDAYLVGGAVRDELLGLESKDADFLVPGVDTDGLMAALAWITGTFLLRSEMRRIGIGADRSDAYAIAADGLRQRGEVGRRGDNIHFFGPRRGRERGG